MRRKKRQCNQVSFLKSCQFLKHICMLINIIVGDKEAEDRERDRITKSWRSLRKQGKYWSGIVSHRILPGCICSSVGRLVWSWLMMTFLSLWGMEIRYDASVFNAIDLLNLIHIRTSRGDTLHAFRITTFSCVHVQLLILKHGHCTLLPRTDRFSSPVTRYHINFPHPDSPGVYHREPAHSLLFLLVSPI